MKLLDMMREQVFEERMATAAAHGALVRIAQEAGDNGEYDDAMLAWLLTGSHEWPEDVLSAEDIIAQFAL